MDARRATGNRKKAAVSLLWLVVFLSFLPLLLTVPGQAQPFADEAELRAEIERRRAVLRRPCDEVQKLMERLIYLGDGYQRLEGERTASFYEIAQQEFAYLHDFMLSGSSDGQVDPGRFYQEFMDIKERAEQAGVLAAGPKPRGIGWEKLVRQQDAGQYFFFASDGEKDPERTALRWQLEDEQVELLNRWNARRQEYYEAFSDSDLERFNDRVQTPLQVMDELEREYLEKKAYLAGVAAAGEFEHCLGKMRADVPQYQASPSDPGVLVPLHNAGPEDTPGGLPGMGFQMLAPQPFPLFGRQEIPDFPFRLYFKRDGNSYLQYAAELREIQIAAEEEYTLTLGRSWRDVCTLGLTYVLPPEKLIENLPDGAVKDFLQESEESWARDAAFEYGVVYHIVEANATVGNMIINTVKYPFKHGVPKTIGDSYEAIRDFGIAVRDYPIFTLNDQLHDISVKLVAEPLEKLYDGMGAAADLADPRTFEPKEGETLREKLERLDGQCDAVVKVREATEVAEKATGELIMALTGEAQIKAGREALDFVRAGVKSRLGRKTVTELAVQQSKARLALEKIGGLQDEVRLARSGPAEVKALDDLFDRQRALSQRIDELSQQRLVRSTLDDLLDPPARQWTPPKEVKLGPETIRDMQKPLGQGTFSRVYKNARNPNEVIKIPTFNPEQFTESLQRQLKGAELLDDLGIDYAKIKGTGTIDLPDGRNVPMMTQEVVPEGSILQDIIDKNGGTLPRELQEEVVRIVHRANERGIGFGDLKRDNFFAVEVDGRWKVGILDLDFITPPRRLPEVTPSLAELQWAQLTGKVMRNGKPVEGLLAKVAVVDGFGGGSAGSLGKFIDEDLAELILSPEKARAHFGSDAYLDALKGTDEFQKLSTAKQASEEFRTALDMDPALEMVRGELGINRDKLDRALDAFEKAHANPPDLPEALQDLQKVDVEAEVKVLDDMFERQAQLHRDMDALARAEPPPKVGKAVPVEDEVRVFDPATGQERVLPRGEELGQGSTSKAFVKADNDALVIRTTKFPDGETAHKLDEFGRQAVAEVNSDALRVARRETTYDMRQTKMVWDEQLQASVEREVVVGKAEVIEKVDDTAKEIMARNMEKIGAPLTRGQKLAYEQAVRDLNSSGYAWLDNHYRNFSFEKMVGEDRWRVVVIDPGGIVKVKGATVAEMAENAAAMQRRLKEVTATPFNEHKMLENVQKKQEVFAGTNELAAPHAVDLDAMGLDDVNEIEFALKPDIRSDVGDLTQLPDAELAQQIRTHTEAALAGDPGYQALKAEFDQGQQQLVGKLDEFEQLTQQADEALEATRRRTGCCTRARSKDESCECVEYAETPRSRSTPLRSAYLQDLGPLLANGALEVLPGDGVRFNAGNATLSATLPGRRSAILRGYGSTCTRRVPCFETGTCQRSSTYDVCLDYGRGKSIDRVMEFPAVKYIRFGIPGLDFSADGKDIQPADKLATDFFAGVPRKDLRSWGNLSGLGMFPQPGIVVEDEYGLRMVDAGEYEALMETEIVQPGPIGLEGYGTLMHLGGTGSTTLRWRLSRDVEVTHTLTVNQVEWNPHPDMDGIVQQGATYPVRLLVEGGADMSRYSAVWSSSDLASWTQPSTSFTQSGNLWVSENELTVQAGDDLSWKDNYNKMIGVSAAIRGDTTLCTFVDSVRTALPVIQQLSLRPADPRGGSPPRLRLKGTGQGRARQQKEVDLFFPNELSRGAGILLEPYIACWEPHPLTGPSAGDLLYMVPFRDVYGQARLEVTSTNPEVVGAENFVLRPTSLRPGTSQVYARFGKDINQGQSRALDDREIFSDTLTVTANQLILHAEDERQGRSYRLTIHGPASMGDYQVVFKLGSSKRTVVEPVRVERGVYTASVTSTLDLRAVQITRNDTAVAQIGPEVAVPQPRIRLVFSQPPMTTLGKTELVDASSLQTITECEQEQLEVVEAFMEAYGINPGIQPTQYCRELRQRSKESMKEARVRQKAYNQFIEELDDSGRELVVFQDVMKVGAGISRLSRRHWQNAFCRWELTDESGVELEEELSPVIMTSPDLGGCFNMVRGIQDGFDPEAGLKVKLVVETSQPEKPQLGRSGRFVGIPGVKLEFPNP